jgi:hypothetical protein
MSAQVMATPLWYAKMMSRWVILAIVTTIGMGYAGATREMKMTE